jgi:uncharacterized membrane protein
MNSVGFKRRYRFVLRIARLFSLVILVITALISGLAILGVALGFRWGSSWSAVGISILFFVISISFRVVLSWMLLHEEQSLTRNREEDNF